MEDHELNRLLNRLIEGTISEQDFQRVQQLMREDPKVRAEYYDLLGVDMMLHERYEVPDYISVHAKTADDHWVVARSHRKLYIRAAWAAAIMLLLSLGAFFLIDRNSTDATLASSVDSSYTINGEAKPASALNKDELLEVKSGVVQLAIGPYVEACVEGPAKVKLLAHKGKLELQEGSIFLQISPGGRGFEVHTPAGIIRNIGTKFGVLALADGSVQTHVTSGIVEIERKPGEARQRVTAGNGATWTTTGPIKTHRNAAERFVQTLPWDEVLFQDDFSEGHGSPLKDKVADVGGPWKVESELNPTTLTNGKLDTSTGWRTLTAKFREEQSSSSRRVYMTTFSTHVPENIWDKGAYLDAAERITFNIKGNGHLFSMVARKSRGHHWQLKNEKDGVHSIGTRISALQPHMVTVTYDTGSGEVKLYEGTGTGGLYLDGFKVEAGKTLDSLTLSNDEGGDLSIDDLTVKVATYSQNGDHLKRD
ncbi:FecR domain-containing protein [Luteolibacter luteus]|uniref:FecR domain-containing protein n=1 Tax=Luteolibacter luteus TaxID=2728835 RepID=A0A858RS84_9BACT|nr:FecR domain-containing protein [Luteolibacter luteus]QJE98803.1 FecR domain-containing protein [Luteolibacter luteus]